MASSMRFSVLVSKVLRIALPSLILGIVVLMLIEQ